MNSNEVEVLRVTFQNLLDRNVAPELLQDFINRTRLYHNDKPDLLAVLDDLETQIPKGV